MSGDVLVSLFKSVVFLDVVQVVTTNDHCTLHLQLGDYTTQDTPADEDVTGEGALLVDVGSLDRLRNEKHTTFNTLGNERAAHPTH